MGILALLASYSKQILIAAAVIAAVALGYKLYTTIKLNGQYEIIIDNQRRALEDKQQVIDALEKTIDLTAEIAKEREQELQILYDQLQGLTDDLGSDENDLAPASLRELLERLSKL